MRLLCSFIWSDAFHSAKMLCDQYYLHSPDLLLQEMNSKFTLISSGSLNTNLIWLLIPYPKGEKSL